jgi:V/A-type H+-transporting ATPase subunit E
METENNEASGVQQLIDRLHQEGVDKGRSDADSLLSAARKEAASILDEANKQAEEIRKSAKSDADQMKSKGEEAVRLAGRDAILSLTEELRASFEETLQRFVHDSLQDPTFLRQLIMQIAGVAVPSDDDAALKVLLLGDVSEDEPSEGGQTLNDLARSLAGQSLRDGLTFEVVDSDVPGVRVQVVDQQLEIDLTTDTLTHLLLKHLSPRIRAIVGQ